LSTSDVNVLFLLPQYGGQLTTQFFESMMDWAQEAATYGVQWNYLVDPGATLLPMARSQLLSLALELDDWTHVCMVDSDMGFTPRDLCELILADKDIIAALTPVKAYPMYMNSSSEYARGIEKYEGPLAKCKYVGTGMMVVKRETVEKMHDHYYDTLSFKTVDGHMGEQVRYNVVDLFATVTNGANEQGEELYLSEDYAFCQRARDIGLEVWSHSKVNPTHTGMHTFSVEGEAKMLERYKKQGKL